MTKKENIEELKRLLEAHDFYYMYSDDSKVYDKGRVSQDKIDALIEHTGSKGKKMYQQFLLIQ